MQKINSREDNLKNSLKKILAKEDLSLHKDLINQLSTELSVSALDCAAALCLLNQPDLYPKKPLNKVKERAGSIEKPKCVRYRLDLGKEQNVSINELKNVLIEVSGVDKNNIGRMDIRHNFTLVDLPDGMPADIFQLLSETEINKQRLNIKRVKYKRRFKRKKTVS